MTALQQINPNPIHANHTIQDPVAPQRDQFTQDPQTFQVTTKEQRKQENNDTHKQMQRCGRKRINMDTTERQGIERDLAIIERALQQQPPADALAGLQFQQNLQDRLNNLIPQTDELSAEILHGWRQVSNDLRTVQNGNDDSSFLAPTTLPKVFRTQNNRVRLEEELCLLIRQPFFAAYEAAVVQSQQQFFGITGPQGFGKSPFLHYFATKYCAEGTHLVVYLPSCPTTTEALKDHLAQAFYQGCQIAELNGYKELTLSNSLSEMLVVCIEFAVLKNKRLLLLIDQMKTEPQALFDSTIDAIGNLSGDPITAIMASSISHRFSSIFGNRVQSLPRYSQKITVEEAALLAEHAHKEDVAAADLVGLPFQVAAEKLNGTQVSLNELARDLAELLLTSAGDGSRQQAYFYLLMAADSTRKDSERGCNFGSTLDGDYFYVDQDSSGRFFIAEYREGFAAEVLAIMRSRPGDYEQYLLALLDNPNFITLDAGAKGRIVEDCFTIILRGQANIRLPFMKIPGGGNTVPQAVVLDAGKKSVFDVPGGDEAVLESVNWLSNIELLVFIPRNRSYKGIDFIIARKTDNTLYIYFVHCTIQLPQNHPICETQLYEQWQNLLVSKSTATNWHSYLVFLTPHSTNLNVPGPGSIATFFRRKTKLHVQFDRIEGTHPLLDKIKTRFARL